MAAVELGPLPLTSGRWATLKAHFGNASKDGEEVPSVTKLLPRWWNSVGTYAEEYEYDLLRESYLHQGTILDIAYAVVPHLVVHLPALDPDRRAEVLDDIAEVEAVRLTPRSKVQELIEQMSTIPEKLRDTFIQNTRDRHPELADDLAPAYLSAIEHAKQFAGKTWNEGLSMPMGPHRWRRHVRFLRESELTDHDIRFGVQALTKEPETLVYLGLDDAEQWLTAAENVPAKWLKRTGIGTASGRLVLRALFALAWIERHAKIDTMLGTEAVDDGD